jgi:hypothetical protein
MKKTRHALAALAVLAFLVAAVPAVQAHGGHDHVMGKVKTVDLSAGTVVVEGRYNKETTVSLNGDTKFMRGASAAAASDLAVGMRVVIDADTVDGKTVAKEIRLAEPNKSPAAEANPSKP